MGDNYLANPLLKKAHVKHDWSKEEIEEYVKCSKDISYFIVNYVKIINLDKGLVPFDMYPYQAKMAETIHDNRFTIIKTCRQAGKTTTSAAVVLWHALFNKDYAIGILANKLTTAREILARVQRAFENLPKWLQQGVVEWNKTTVEFENGSKILASSTASSAIRGYSINFLYLDEFAFVPRNIQDEFFTSVYPTIISGTNTKVVITSTPNGFDLFYKIWTNAEEKRNEYIPFYVNWFDVPGRDAEWKKKTIANTSADQFRQEFEAEFLGSANTLIAPTTLKSLVFKDPIKKGYDGALSIYKEPTPDSIYYCTVDTARGRGLDSSAFIIFDVSKFPYEVVAVYKSNIIDPISYPDIIYNVVKAYNDAYTLIEINDNGEQITSILHGELEYENTLSTTTMGQRGQTIGSGFGGRNSQLGVRTTKNLKRIGCSTMKTLIESNKIILNDYDILEELSTFIQTSSSYEAEQGAHDDLAMCVVLLAWSTAQSYFKELTNTDFRAKLREDRKRLEDEQIMPMPIYDDGDPDNIINTIDDSNNFLFGDPNEPKL